MNTLYSYGSEMTQWIWTKKKNVVQANDAFQSCTRDYGTDALQKNLVRSIYNSTINCNLKKTSLRGDGGLEFSNNRFFFVAISKV